MQTFRATFPIGIFIVIQLVNFMATSLDSDLSHGKLLSDSLQRLQLLSSDNGIDPTPPPPRSLSSVLHEGYGFRPTSGGSTPPNVVHSVDHPLPDCNGLGWPGRLLTSWPIN